MLNEVVDILTEGSQRRAAEAGVGALAGSLVGYLDERDPEIYGDSNDGSNLMSKVGESAVYTAAAGGVDHVSDQISKISEGFLDGTLDHAALAGGFMAGRYGGESAGKGVTAVEDRLEDRRGKL